MLRIALAKQPKLSLWGERLQSRQYMAEIVAIFV
jgi:hypothetical protein